MASRGLVLCLGGLASALHLQSASTRSYTRLGSVAESVVAAHEDDEENMDESYTTQIFCNRELNMQQIEAVGFDMDYTLARYTLDFDLLAFNGAKAKLLENGYPACVADFTYDPKHHRRGLIIDKRRGNIIKVDRHKYCSIAYHGSRLLTAEERKKEYVGVEDSAPTFVDNDFVNVDSLFQLVDASLYSQLVDVLDKDPELFKKKSYKTVYADVRHAVDMCHHDGVIKDKVAEDPGRYIVPDDDMAPMMEQFRRAGKRTFLLTNSLFDYTNVVMNFLTKSPGGPDGRSWIDLFDVVVVGACKPAFLGDGRRELFRVDVAAAGGNLGVLHNVRGAPLDVIGSAKFLQREGRVFQGGTWKDLHRLLELQSGSQLLYVGDHMYSDVVRSKRSLGWRTTLIIPELTHELRVGYTTLGTTLRLATHSAEYDAAEADADEIRLEMLGGGEKKNDAALAALLGEAEGRIRSARDSLRETRERLHAQYHNQWGPIFETGQHSSRFAKQVNDYACTYTSKVTNLINYSPSRSFRPVQDFMPHDQKPRVALLDLIDETMMGSIFDDMVDGPDAADASGIAQV